MSETIMEESIMDAAVAAGRPRIGCMMPGQQISTTHLEVQ